MECHHTYAACVAAPRPTGASPDCPASLPTFRAASLGTEAAGMAPLSLEGWRPFPILPNSAKHTHTHRYKCTHPHCSFCILTFNQALSRASVSSLSTRCVKDLSPRVTSLTDLLTDRPLAHLAADATAGSTAGSTPQNQRISLDSFRVAVALIINVHVNQKDERKVQG